jgi:signal peptidase II
MLGGALGNLGDRIFRSPEPFQGHVVDFILLPNYPMFNISDSAVVIAAITMTILSIRGVEYSAPGIAVHPETSDES